MLEELEFHTWSQAFLAKASLFLDLNPPWDSKQEPDSVSMFIYFFH